MARSSSSGWPSGPGMSVGRKFAFSLRHSQLSRIWGPRNSSKKTPFLNGLADPADLTPFARGKKDTLACISPRCRTGKRVRDYEGSLTGRCVLGMSCVFLEMLYENLARVAISFRARWAILFAGVCLAGIHFAARIFRRHHDFHSIVHFVDGHCTIRVCATPSAARAFILNRRNEFVPVFLAERVEFADVFQRRAQAGPHSRIRSHFNSRAPDFSVHVFRPRESRTPHGSPDSSRVRLHKDESRVAIGSSCNIFRTRSNVLLCRIARKQRDLASDFSSACGDSLSEF